MHKCLFVPCGQSGWLLSGDCGGTWQCSKWLQCCSRQARSALCPCVLHCSYNHEPFCYLCTKPQFAVPLQNQHDTAAWFDSVLTMLKSTACRWTLQCQGLPWRLCINKHCSFRACRAHCWVSWVTVWLLHSWHGSVMPYCPYNCPQQGQEPLTS